MHSRTFHVPSSWHCAVCAVEQPPATGSSSWPSSLYPLSHSYETWGVVVLARGVRNAGKGSAGHFLALALAKPAGSGPRVHAALLRVESRGVRVTPFRAVCLDVAVLRVRGVHPAVALLAEREVEAKDRGHLVRVDPPFSVGVEQCGDHRAGERDALAGVDLAAVAAVHRVRRGQAFRAQHHLWLDLVHHRRGRKAWQAGERALVHEAFRGEHLLHDVVVRVIARVSEVDACALHEVPSAVVFERRVPAVARARVLHGAVRRVALVLARCVHLQDLPERVGHASVLQLVGQLVGAHDRLALHLHSVVTHVLAGHLILGRIRAERVRAAGRCRAVSGVASHLHERISWVRYLAPMRVV
eukprot:633149-Rhodomonas_salina.2